MPPLPGRQRRTSLHTARAVDRTRVLDTLVNNLEGMVYRCLDDAQWTMIFVSQGCTALTGHAPADIIDNATLSWADITHPEDRPWVGEQISQAVREGRRFSLQYRILTRGGDLRWVIERGIAVPDEQGRTVIEGFIEDITARKVTLDALEHTELRYRHIFEYASEGIFQTTQDGHYLAANPALARLYGYASPHELIADLSDIENRLYIDPERRNAFRHIMETRGEVINFESEVRRRDGSHIWISENAHTVRDASGRFICYEGTVQDISERRHAEEHLHLLATVFSNSNEAIMVTDAANRIIATNQAFTKLTGYTQEEVAGQNPSMLSAGRTPRDVYRDMWTRLESTGAWQGELWDRRKSGEPYPKWLSISLVRDEHGQIQNYIGSFIDISELKASEERIRHLAHHDPLTNLPNRFSLNEKLEQAVGFCTRKGVQMALMLIDLDRFKAINDTLGHHVGDELLVQVARRLSATVRKSDIVARLGGDEFVVVLPGVDSPADAAHVADKIVQTVSAPYQVGGQEQRTSPSIGICIYPDDATEIGGLLKNADMAMYHAKSKGRGNYQFFTENMNAAIMRRIALESELRVGLERGQFVLHYQPQQDLRNGRLVGMEALVRWQHPVRGLIPPAEFIPVAEETGIIDALGDWVLQEALRQLAEWRTRGLTGLRMSINLSTGQFLDKTLPARVDALLARHGLAAGLIDLEVTESVSMASPDETIEVMRALTQRGLNLSIDDFGTGYSSLAYLKLFPIRTLKIDRSFVKDIETDPSDADICDVTVLLAHKLGLEVVAEGVETEAQLKFLRSIGCEKIQGYLISRPLPADQLEALLRQPAQAWGSGAVEIWPPR